jgi:hypothetical protein
MAGYAMWKPLHERLKSRLEILPPRMHRTPTHITGNSRIFVQVPVRCPTEAQLPECRGQLLDVFRVVDGQSRATPVNETVDLLWSVVDDATVTLESGADRCLNVFRRDSTDQALYLCTKILPLSMILAISPGDVFQFRIRIAANDCPPQYQSITVAFGSRWDDITLS